MPVYVLFEWYADKRKKKEFVPEVVQALSELFLVVESFSKVRRRHMHTATSVCAYVTCVRDTVCVMVKVYGYVA